MKAIEKRAAFLLGTRGDGFDPLEHFKKLNDKEKLRLINVVKTMNLSLDEHKDDE